MSEMKYAIKDSVFTFLFRQPEYLLELYQALHPEDTDITEADCELVTIENVLSNGLYNDLGVQVRDKLLLLVEAQSTSPVNIPLRLMLYLAETYKQYVRERKLDLYGTGAVRIPRPELYVIYTGGRKGLPEVLKLSDLYGGSGSVEVEVQVLQDRGRNDIVDQYVGFCKISDEERKKYGYTQKAIDETIRRCREAGLLTDFLEARQKEVNDIMVTLFSQEEVTAIHDYNMKREAHEEGIRKGLKRGLEKGLKKGREEGREEGIREIVSILNGMSIPKRAVAQTLTERFALTQEAAEQKVEQYWN